MKSKFDIRIPVLFLIIAIFGCGSSKTLKPQVEDNFPELPENIFQVATWNIEAFPKQGTSTLNILQNTIEDMSFDIIAVQEINDTDELEVLDNMLNDYSCIASYPHSPNSEYYNPVVGYIINDNTVTVNRSYKIFTQDSRLFPRTPYLIDLVWNDQEITIINLHLKASGDNIIDYNDEWDEELRRLQALDTLHDYIENELADRNVIVVGDMNDEIQDSNATNVFTSFINDSNYVFADDAMVQDIDNYSYPGWPSHLDHIILSNELHDEFNNENSDCYTIKIDNIINGYESLVSDHRPVLLNLYFNMEK